MYGLAFHLSSSVSLVDHSAVRFSVGLVTNATDFSVALIDTSSPSYSWNRVAPSRLTQALDLPSSGFRSLIDTFSGRIKGLNERECGARGVREIAGTLLCMIEPPAARLYAVDPVGVDMISLLKRQTHKSYPSPTTVVK